MRRNWIFDAGARAYDLLTGQAFWAAHIDHLVSHLPAPVAGARWLDLGCGPGVSAFVAAGRVGPGVRIVGLDLARVMLERARAHQRRRYPDHNVRFVRGDGTQLPFRDGAFAAAFAHSFLYLVPDRPGVLAEAWRCLAPGGKLALVEPAREGGLLTAAWRQRAAAGRMLRRPLQAARFWASMVGWRSMAHLHGPLGGAELAALLEGAGFEDVRCTATLGGIAWVAEGRRPPRG